MGTVAGRESVGHAEEGIKAGGPDRLEQEAERKKKKKKSNWNQVS